MYIYQIIQLNLWPRSRENPIYGSLTPLGLVFTGVATPALLASLANKKLAPGVLEKAHTVPVRRV